MDTLAVFGLQLVLSLLVYALLAKWFVTPWVDSLGEARGSKASRSYLPTFRLPYISPNLTYPYLFRTVLQVSHLPCRAPS